MNDLTHLDDAQTMSSREIAELTDKDHRNVTRDIRAMCEELEVDVLKLEHIYLDSLNREQKEYHLDRELTDTLVTGYSAKLRRAVIKRWHDLETGRATPLHQLSADDLEEESRRLRSRMSIVDTMAQLRERSDKVEEERDWLREQEEKLATLLEDDTRRNRYRMSRKHPGHIESVPEGEELFTRIRTGR